MAKNLKYTSHWLIDLVDPEANHDKYYEAFIVPPAPSGINNAGNASEWMCVLHWGRRGGKGQIQIHHGSAAEVNGIAGTKHFKKLSEGYKVISSSGQPGTLSDQLMEQIEQKGVPVGGWAKNGWAATVQDGALLPERLQVDLSSFVQVLLGTSTVTPDMVTQRATFNEQMEELRRAVQEAEAAAELMDTVFAKRLS